MYFSGSKAPTYFQENFGAFFVLVAFILKLMDVWCYPIAIKLSLCKVNFRRDCFFFLRGKFR
ncbi:hypothetical protein COL26_12790 [Bacillus thuringiensis]|uniref:Histidine kinase n=1 Tax=Bacillus thuringiensis TaxID=1428 RepID=A0ABD6S3U4_BACTU|nr:hypothetical protein CN495_19845 [Bacillus thuringiensis]PFI10429.1 hypothetical protein COI79_08830 [Bacillus thuringiensis]PFW42846.1 hypothetical protein COL26_12790 [Bacillus thuringiensis]PGY57618.1 hypothetical protein COE44_34515 [Bacillus thuringiensis]